MAVRVDYLRARDSLRTGVEGTHDDVVEGKEHAAVFQRETGTEMSGWSENGTRRKEEKERKRKGTRP